MENLRECKKTVLKKQNKRLYNLETLKSIHAKFGALP